MTAVRGDRSRAVARAALESGQVHVPARNLATGNPGEALMGHLEQLGVHVTSVINNAGFAGFGPFHGLPGIQGCGKPVPRLPTQYPVTAEPTDVRRRFRDPCS
ncbi:hypothetical protein [Streptomyces griseus]|uniref:hypothetical protein n=1 Tax=Streptomyces griseus TaxID=1911 RepID=UPI000559E9E4|nr:hypothetical protein [Streptomyces griseus]